MPQNVPKFASFKPRDSAPIKSESGLKRRRSQSRSRERTQSHTSLSHRTVSRHERKRDDHREERHSTLAVSRPRHRSRSRDRSRHPRSHDNSGHGRRDTSTQIFDSLAVSSRSLQLTNGHVEPLFRVDTRGDLGFEQYGKNDSSAVPSYHHPGEDLTIGTKLSRSHQPNASLLGRLTKDELARLDAPATPLHTVSHALDEQSDYVPLSLRLGSDQSRRRTRRLGTEDDPEEEESGLSESEAVTVGHEQELDSGLIRHHNLLVQCTKQQSSNAAAWLALLDFQEQWSVRALGEPALASSSPRIRTAVIENKLQVIEDALKASQWDPTDLVRFNLIRMRFLACLKSPPALMAAWDALSSSLPRSAVLAVERQLNVVQSAPEKDKDTIEESFVQCMSTLTAANYDDDRWTLSHLRIRLLVGFTTWLGDLGYHERALAIWQALLDWNCRAVRNPASHGASPEDHSSLSQWGENVFEHVQTRRLGEEGSFIKHMRAALMAKLTALKQAQSGRTPTGARIAAEVGLDERCWRAIQGSTERKYVPELHLDEDAGLDDDYREVVFSLDLESALFTDPSQYRTMIDGFLAFMRLPPLPSSDLSETPLLVSNGFDASKHSIRVGEACSFRLIPAFSSIDTLFAQPGEPSYAFNGVDTAEPRILFAANMVETIAHSFPNDEGLVEYVLAFALHLNAKESSSMAKQFLILNPGSSRVQVAAAIVEGRQDVDPIEAEKITSSRLLDLISQDDKNLTLWKAFSHTFWQASKIRLGYHRLTTIGTSPSTTTPPSSKPLAILRARTTMTGYLNTSLESADHSTTLVSASLLLNISLFSTNSLSSLHDTFTSLLASLLAANLSAHSTILHLFHQHYASLLYIFTTHHLGPFDPSFLLAQLAILTARFPLNPLFPLYTVALQFTLSPERIRATLAELRAAPSPSAPPLLSAFSRAYPTTSTTPSPYTALANLSADLHRTPLLAPALARLTHILAPTADLPPTFRHDPHLWLLHLTLLARQSGPRRQRVRDAFFEATRRCPWSKALVLRALAGEVREAMGLAEAEVRGVLGELALRGVRFVGGEIGTGA